MDGERPAGSGPIVAGSRVVVSGEAVRIGPPKPDTPEPGEPSVQLVREDGVVRAIDVTCGCGARIRIRCEY
jgi:hypothetical protein